MTYNVFGGTLNLALSIYVIRQFALLKRHGSITFLSITINYNCIQLYQWQLQLQLQTITVKPVIATCISIIKYQLQLQLHSNHNSQRRY